MQDREFSIESASGNRAGGQEVIIEGRDYTGPLIIGPIYAVLIAALTYFSGRWAQASLELGYSAGIFGCAVWPLLVMLRHRRRQDRLLDQIRATYVLAVGDLMAGRVRAATRRLEKIRGLERRWRFGANPLYRGALLTYVLGSNVALAFFGMFCAACLNQYPPKPLSET